MYYIIILDMFRAILCSSSGGQNSIVTASGIVTLCERPYCTSNLLLALHVTFISVLGRTCGLDICPWPYVWPWYLSLALHVTLISLAVHVALISVLGLTCNLDIRPWPYMWPWYPSLTLHVTLIYVLGLTCDLDISPWSYLWPWHICHLSLFLRA
jgi:hypothetical protein